MIPFRRQSSLVNRIMVSIMLGSVFFLTLLSIVVYYTNEILEFDFLSKQTSSELKNVQHLLSQNPQAPLPKLAGTSIYLASRHPGQPIPAHLLRYPVGEYHNIRVGDKALHILVAEHGDDRIYIQFDITDIERSEEILALVLITAWIVMIVLIFFIALFLSRKLSEPITRLSRELASIGPDERSVRLSGEFEDDEVGTIAQAFDSYTRKMDSYVEKQIAFTAMASHELRTPLSIVQSSSDLIATQQIEPGVAIHLDKIKRSSKNMANVIHALLAVTQDKPTRNIHQSIKLRPLTDEIIAVADAEIQGRKIQIENCLDQRLSLKADKILVDVILSNLISNALRHSKQGTVKIEASADSISIVDQGIGIDPGQLSHIFEYDFGDEENNSFGIGLYISKLICNHEDWSLELEPNTFGGTTAIVGFPALAMS